MTFRNKVLLLVLIPYVILWAIFIMNWIQIPVALIYTGLHYLGIISTSFEFDWLLLAMYFPALILMYDLNATVKEHAHKIIQIQHKDE